MLRHLFNGETYSDVSVNEYNNKENNTIAQLYVYHENVLVESDPCVRVYVCVCVVCVLFLSITQIIQFSNNKIFQANPPTAL